VPEGRRDSNMQFAFCTHIRMLVLFTVIQGIICVTGYAPIQMLRKIKMYNCVMFTGLFTF
jgi:hypothetical protein